MRARRFGTSYSVINKGVYELYKTAELPNILDICCIICMNPPSVLQSTAVNSKKRHNIVLSKLRKLRKSRMLLRGR